MSQLPSVKQYVKYELHRRQDEFTNRRDLTVFAGSWNLHAQEPSEPLRDWLVSPAVSAGVPRPDIYAIGFQELVELTTGNVVGKSLTERRAEMWTQAIEKELNVGMHGDDSYKPVLCSHLVGICLLIFVAKRYLPHISGVDGQTTGVGVLGMMGNKGACAIRLHIYDSSICFVSSHLAAHRSNVHGRNKDFANICSRTRFRANASDAERQQYSIECESGKCGILEHEFVVWVGDLNYRFNNTLTREECVRFIGAKDLDELRYHDQLNTERKQGRVFNGFSEGTLNFFPTYKFVHGVDRYDAGAEDKEHGGKKPRMPAWTDRILYYEKHNLSGTSSHIKQLLYQSCLELKNSDHRPVLALFEIKVKDINKQRRQEICDELVRTHDMWENQSIPKVQLSVNTLVFGDLRFARVSTQLLQLQNTGQVPAVYSFVPKGSEDDICSNWLTIAPLQGVVMPGTEKTVNITACIDASAARKGSVQELSDILVLHVENGADYFITIQGSYMSACFGASIQSLAGIEGEYAEVEGVPGIIVELINSLRNRHCWRKQELFVEGGSAEEFQEIRDCFDSYGRLGDGEVHSFAEALFEFLMSTPAPLIPSSLLPHAHVADDAMAASWGRQLLGKLSDEHRQTFLYIVEFLREAPLTAPLTDPPGSSSSTETTETELHLSQSMCSQASCDDRQGCTFSPLVLAAVFSSCFLHPARTEECAPGFAGHLPADLDCLQRLLRHLLTAPSVQEAISSPASSPKDDKKSDLIDINDWLS